MDQKLKRTNTENKSVNIKGDVTINGDGIIGNENKITKKSFNKREVGIITFISVIAAIIAIYSFIFQ